MRGLVDADSLSLKTASTGGDAPQQSEIVFRGNHAHHWHGKRETQREKSENAQMVHMSRQNCRVGSAAPTTSKKRANT